MLSHVPKVLNASSRYEMAIAEWDALDPELKTLDQMARAALIGCSWCLDFGYLAAFADGQPVARLKEVPRWRESSAFGETERAVLA